METTTTTVQLEEYTRIAITGEASKIIALKWWLRRLGVKAYSLESQEEDDRQLVGIFRARDAQIITDWIKENAAPAMAEVLAPPPLGARYKKPATWAEALGTPALEIVCNGENGGRGDAFVLVPYRHATFALCHESESTDAGALIDARLIESADLIVVPHGARRWKIFAQGKQITAELGEPKPVREVMSSIGQRLDTQRSLTKLTERKCST